MRFHPSDSPEERYAKLRDAGYIVKYSGKPGTENSALQIELIRRQYHGTELFTYVLQVRGKVQLLIGKSELSD